MGPGWDHGLTLNSRWRSRMARPVALHKRSEAASVGDFGNKRRVACADDISSSALKRKPCTKSNLHLYHESVRTCTALHKELTQLLVHFAAGFFVLVGVLHMQLCSGYLYSYTWQPRRVALLSLISTPLKCPPPHRPPKIGRVLLWRNYPLTRGAFTNLWN